MAAKGYRIFDGKAYVLNGLVDGYTPEEAKDSAVKEASRLRDCGFDTDIDD